MSLETQNWTGTLQHKNCSPSLVPFVIFLRVLTTFFCEQQRLVVPMRYCLAILLQYPCLGLWQATDLLRLLV